MDREVVFAQKGKEAASNSLAALQTKYDALVSQQSNWDALNTATEKINLVFNLLENADSEEQKELRHYRDHCKTLEDENAAMQKRFKDADSKLANSERSGASLRQTLTQAQLRSEEWERLAKAAQGSAEMLETKLEQAEQTQSQLDADYQLVKVQLDEKEADSRLQAVSVVYKWTACCTDGIASGSCYEAATASRCARIEMLASAKRTGEVECEPALFSGSAIPPTH